VTTFLRVHSVKITLIDLQLVVSIAHVAKFEIAEFLWAFIISHFLMKVLVFTQTNTLLIPVLRHTARPGM
jgi:hypothetical protein